MSLNNICQRIIPVILVSLFVIPAVSAKGISALSYSISNDISALSFVKPPIALGGKVAVVKFKLDLGDVSVHELEGYDYLKVGKLKPSTAPGEPMLPMKNFVVKFPKNSKILGVQIIGGKYVPIVNKLNISPTPEPLEWTIGKKQKFKREPKKEVYSLKDYFSGKFVSYMTGSDNEYTYVFVKVWPVQYIPAQGKAILLTDGTIQINYMVQSPPEVAHHTTNAKNIILCQPELCSVAQELADFHTSEGTESVVVNTSWIYENYTEAEDPPHEGYKNPLIPGYNDIKNYNYSLAKKIILYLRDDAEHPNLEFVTLFGNALQIPPSYYIYIEHGDSYNNWIPADLFYSSPDYDFVPNYKVGRIPVNDSVEAEHVVNKIKNWYGNLSWDWFKNVDLVGGLPFETENYYGEMITVDSINRESFQGMDIKKLFTSDEMFNKDDVMNSLSGDRGFIYVITHGSGECWSIEGLGGSLCVDDLMNLSTNSNSSIVVSIACINGAFDANILPQFWDTSFGEGILLSNASGIAYIGGSRVNYGAPFFHYENGNVVIDSEPYMAGMLTNVFDAYHNGAINIGNLTAEAVKKFVAEHSFSFFIDNVTLFEFVLLGDPALKIPLQQTSPGYQQPIITNIDPEPDFYDFWGLPNYDLTEGTRIGLNGTTDSTQIQIKLINAGDHITLENKSGLTIGNQYNYSFIPGDETIYAIRTSADDAKEGWFYLNIRDIAYQHNVEVTDWTLPAPPYAKPGENIKFNATIKNTGINDESDIEVRFLVDYSINDTQTIPFLATGSSTDLIFEWSENLEKKFTLGIDVVPVSGETNLADNTKEKKFFINSREPIIAGVLDSWGADFHDRTCWDDLNDNWLVHGSEPIFIDYITLNKDEITYQDLTESNADILFISDAYREGVWEFTDSEINTIKRYVKGGHGLIATSGTFSLGWNPGDVWLPTNNNKLAALFGMREDLEYMWPTELGFFNYFNILNTTHPLFDNIATPYYPCDRGSNVPSPDYLWNDSDLAGGEYVAISDNYVAAIIAYRGVSYFTNMPESAWCFNDEQVIYNAITWSNFTSYDHDLIIADLSILVPIISSTIVNVGNNNETSVVRFFVNDTEVNNTNIDLDILESEIVQFYWMPESEGYYEINVTVEPVDNETDSNDNSLTDDLIIKSTDTTTTLPPGVEPPQWFNLRNIPENVTEGDSADIIIDWSDDEGLQTVIISENSAGWVNHTCNLATGECSGELMYVASVSWVVVVVLSGPLIIILVSRFGIVKSSLPSIMLIFTSVILCIIFISILLFPEISRNISSALMRLGIRPMALPQTFTHTIPASQLQVFKTVSYKSYAQDVSGYWNVSETKTFFVQPPIKPDLTLSSSDIVFSNTSPSVGESITINATIQNIGTRNASDIIVQFFDNRPFGFQIGNNQTINFLDIGENKTVSVSWTPPWFGYHTIYVVIDPSNTIDEIDEDNNIVYKNEWIGPSAPDVVGYLGIAGISYVNKSISLTVSIVNIGPENATNVTGILYDYLPNTTKVKIWNRTIGNLSSRDEPFNRHDEIVEWIPETLGDHTLEFVVDCNDDLNADNNVENMSVTVYEPLNVTFYLTDHFGEFTNITLGFPPSITQDLIFINISENLTLPKTETEIWLLKLRDFDYYTVFDGILMWNSTINETMRSVVEHYPGKMYIDNLIIHSLFAYNTSWNYDNATLFFYITNYSLNNPNETSIYVCSEWDWDNEKCISGWEYTSATHQFGGGYIEDVLFSNVKSTNAFALAEPQSIEPTTTTPSGDGSGGGGGGGGWGIGGVTGKTYVVSDEQFAAGYTKELGENDRFKFTLEEETHYVTVDNVTSTTVTINVTSEIQQATLARGEETYFELTDDNYYDLSVKLNDINVISLMADVTIKKIHKEILAETTTTVPIETTTTPTCISTGNPCVSDPDCCSGYCCDDVCSDKECEEVRALTTYYILLIVGLVSVGILVSYIIYTRFTRKIPKPEITPGQTDNKPLQIL